MWDWNFTPSSDILLELDKEARFNSPGTKKGNWGWRLEEMDQLDSSIKNLKLLNEMNSTFLFILYISLINFKLLQAKEISLILFSPTHIVVG